MSKLDINSAPEEALCQLPDIDAKVVNDIKNRTFYFVCQMKPVVGETTFRQIEPFLDEPRFTFYDKLAGRDLQLKADSSQALISKSERERAVRWADQRKLERLFPDAQSASYDVFSISDTAAAADVMAELLQEFAEKALPA